MADNDSSAKTRAPKTAAPKAAKVAAPKTAKTAAPKATKARTAPAAELGAAPVAPSAPMSVTSAAPSRDDVARRAYEIYVARAEAGTPGDRVSDWLQAERELSQG